MVLQKDLIKVHANVHRQRESAIGQLTVRNLNRKRSLFIERVNLLFGSRASFNLSRKPFAQVIKRIRREIRLPVFKSRRGSHNRSKLRDSLGRYVLKPFEVRSQLLLRHLGELERKRRLYGDVAAHVEAILGAVNNLR